MTSTFIADCNGEVNDSMPVYIYLAILTLLPAGLLAHAPQFHDFRLVVFARPLAAPAFQLPDLADQTRELADFRGRYVLLNFWATWCAPCVEEMPALERLYQRLHPHGLTVVAISTDTLEAARIEAFARRLNVTFPVLRDADQAVSKTYGARDLPSTFLLNPQGEVIAAAKGARDWASAQALSYFDELLGVRP